MVGKRRSRRTVTVLALAAGLLGAHLAVFPGASSASYTPSAEGRVAAVATDHSDATRAALEVMAAGGNAADGAAAAALVLGVVGPSASGLGGGGFALVYEASSGKVTALDFRETAPSSFSSDVLWPKGKPASSKSVVDRFGWTGPRGGSVGVPGEPAGLELLVRRFGKRSLAADAAPASLLAEHGFYLSRHTAEQVAMFKDRLAVLPTFASAFLGAGGPATLGTRIRRPELAGTLARFGASGARALYEGDVARKIVDASKAHGGTLSLADLSSYTVKERAPLSRVIGGRTVYTMPAPSAGGLALLELLTMYGANRSSPLAAMGFGSSAYLHTVAEALRGSFADRARIAGDPDLDPAVTRAYDAALEPSQLAARRARIEPGKTHAPLDFRTKEQGTSHVVVADAAGNVVTLTTTVNGPFGSGVVAGDTGILLNNELDDFTTAEDASSFALADGGPNKPRPRARPVSSMTPTLVLENGAPILALGGSGGTRITTGVVQAALARLVFDLDPNACVSHPRVHTQGPALLVDPEIAADVRDGLKGRGETVRDETFTGSAIQMIAWQRTSATPGAPGGTVKMLAAADPRKGGLAAAR